MEEEEFYEFSKPITIDPLGLSRQPFKENQKVKHFTCGEPDLDEFLTTTEVKSYENARLGKTTLVYYGGDLVAFYTLSPDSLETKMLKKHKGFSKDPFLTIKAIPSLKIGRFAVDTKHQGKGIGRILMTDILLDAATDPKYPFRLAIVQAKEKAFSFYSKSGFQFTDEDHLSERSRWSKNRTRTMFFDLETLKEL